MRAREVEIEVSQDCVISQSLYREQEVIAYGISATAYPDRDDDGNRCVEYDYDKSSINWKEEYNADPDNLTPLELIEELSKLLADERIRAIVGEKKAKILAENCKGWECDYYEVEES